jgi:predicted nuclease of restriction endonuclease-like (RecB) superfamily
MDHLQEFLLEMGKGFCFEARQKRIIIDDEYLKVKKRWSKILTALPS